MSVEENARNNKPNKTDRDAQIDLLTSMGVTMLHSRSDRKADLIEARADREELLAELRRLLATRSWNLLGALQAFSKIQAGVIASAAENDGHFEAGVTMARACLELDARDAYALREQMAR
jgi:hypothetical protein